MGLFSSIAKLSFTPALLADALTPKAANTPTPAQAQFEPVINEIAGTKSERVKQPDGTWATVIKKLPLSAEDQAYYDELQNLRASSLNYIKDLTENYDVAKIPGLQQYLKDYETSANQAIDRAAGVTANQEEKTLARYGQADSTAAANARVGRAATVMDQRASLGRDMSAIEQNARNDEISRQSGLYSLATGGITGQQNTQLGSVAGLLSTGLAQQANSQNYNNTLAGIAAANDAAQKKQEQAGLNNMATITSLLAAPATGGASLALPSLFNAASKSGFAKYGAA
ncbi:hypothetical protein [Rhizobium sp. Nf11,1]|uniref:hypothetical protein n=1 Tax=Rhizobium sp. Nf11,1 TaxID=3404923 RepID=UPI003D34490D